MRYWYWEAVLVPLLGSLLWKLCQVIIVHSVTYAQGHTHVHLELFRAPSRGEYRLSVSGLSDMYIRVVQTPVNSAHAKLAE